MRRALIAAILCVPSAIAAADAPPLEDPFLDRLAGTWVLRGTIAGQQTTHDVTAEWVAGHQYLEIRERSREKADDGRAAYDAVVLLGFDGANATYQCMWLDSTGGGALAPQSIGHGKRTGDSIQFAWETGGAVFLTNTFAYEASADAWTWQIDSLEQGKAVAFGHVRLTRE